MRGGGKEWQVGRLQAELEPEMEHWRSAAA